MIGASRAFSAGDAYNLRKSVTASTPQLRGNPARGFGMSAGDKLLELLSKCVPTSLRWVTVLAITALAALAETLDLIEDYGLWHAVQDVTWLVAATGCCVGLLILTLVRRKTLHTRDRWLCIVVFLVAGCVAGWAASRAYPYVYNELGFEQSRSWIPGSDSTSAATGKNWEWRINAVKDLGTQSLIVELLESDECRFTAFRPTSESPNYTPQITDVTQSTDGSQRWRIHSLRKPAEIIFHLDLEHPGVAPEQCRPRISFED